MLTYIINFIIYYSSTSWYLPSAALSDYRTRVLRVRLKHTQNASNVHIGLDFRSYRNSILSDSCHQSILTFRFTYEISICTAKRVRRDACQLAEGKHFHHVLCISWVKTNNSLLFIELKRMDPDLLWTRTAVSNALRCLPTATLNDLSKRVIRFAVQNNVPCTTHAS